MHNITNNQLLEISAVPREIEEEFKLTTFSLSLNWISSLIRSKIATICTVLAIAFVILSVISLCFTFTASESFDGEFISRFPAEVPEIWDDGTIRDDGQITKTQEYQLKLDLKKFKSRKSGIQEFDEFLNSRSDLNVFSFPELENLKMHYQINTSNCEKEVEVRVRKYILG